MTSLDTWLNRISAIHPVGWDLGLERVGEVGRRLEVIHPAPKVVLVAGTNGKGSTCCYLARMIATSGERFGLSTSPHMFRFNERIVVDGRQVSDETIVDAFERIDAARGDVSLTYFEFSTLASLLIFKDANVDVVILEIGLGGRLDAMNIVAPDLTIITSISLDHQSYLGDTREAIGREKAGIMRPGIPCIVSDTDPPESVLESAERVGAPLALLGRDFLVPVGFQYSLPEESFAAAKLGLDKLGIGLDEAGLKTIAESTHLTGRKTWLEGPCRILLDVAHNPAAAHHLARYLDSVQVEGDIHLLMGIYADKDIAGVIDPLRDKIKTWHLTAMDEDRAASPEMILGHLGEVPDGKTRTYANIRSAIKSMLERVKSDDLVLVAGSFAVVAGVLEFFEETQGRA